MKNLKSHPLNAGHFFGLDGFMGTQYNFNKKSFKILNAEDKIIAKDIQSYWIIITINFIT
jgi:hypothetical protein